jgi:(4-alkanoyl-5-oxo-2,5-dihydrofuran-3-yl)methyl phosphate reductase
MHYLITGATGDVGSRVVEQLLCRGERPRVFVRDSEKARSRYGDRVEIFAGDLAEPSSLRPALEGIAALFLVNTGPQIPARDRAAASAAKDAGVRHMVKLSSMDVEQGLAIGAWHEHGEQAIRESGVPFTFVQPTGFMSNLLAWAHSIQSEGMVRSATGDGRRAFIHSDDIAAVSVAALTTGNYAGQSLPITGPHALTFAGATAAIGSALKKPLVHQPISDAEARRRYAATGASPEDVDAHAALWRAIREGRLAKVTDQVERILGRRPIAFEQWVQENIAAFQ